MSEAFFHAEQYQNVSESHKVKALASKAMSEYQHLKTPYPYSLKALNDLACTVATTEQIQRKSAKVDYCWALVKSVAKKLSMTEDLRQRVNEENEKPSMSPHDDAIREMKLETQTFQDRTTCLYLLEVQRLAIALELAFLDNDDGDKVLELSTDRVENLAKRELKESTFLAPYNNLMSTLKRFTQHSLPY
jgi:hypothetical protein